MADKDFVVKNGFSVNGSILVVNTGTSSVGINTSTPDANVKVVGTANVTGAVAFSNTLAVTGNVSLSNTLAVTGNVTVTSNVTTIGTSLYLVANGNIGFGLNNPAYKIDVAGAINATGDITSSSDLRLKKNIEKIENALAKVMKLNGVTFEKIGVEGKSTGLIAQDVAKVLPEAVSEKDKYLSVAYGNMIGLLVEAIKELKQEVDKLKHAD